MEPKAVCPHAKSGAAGLRLPVTEASRAALGQPETIPLQPETPPRSNPSRLRVKTSCRSSSQPCHSGNKASAAQTKGEIPTWSLKLPERVVDFRRQIGQPPPMITEIANPQKCYFHQPA